MAVSGPVGYLGSLLRERLADVGETGMLVGDALWQILRGRINWEETFYQIERYGIASLPIVALSASFIGMAISVQIAREMVVRYGADTFVGGFVSVSMCREFAPIFVAVVLAGNIGASMTAEIGTMKVTEQVDALQVFRVRPINYLVVPRLVSTAISGPVLTIFGAFVAILSGQLFTEFMVSVSAPIFWESVRFNTDMTDIVSMLVKSLAFSTAIALIAACNGLATQGGSEAVGQRTTRTVVASLLAIFALNYLITSIFFYI